MRTSHRLTVLRILRISEDLTFSYVHKSWRTKTMSIIEILRTLSFPRSLTVKKIISLIDIHRISVRSYVFSSGIYCDIQIVLDKRVNLKFY